MPVQIQFLTLIPGQGNPAILLAKIKMKRVALLVLMEMADSEDMKEEEEDIKEEKSTHRKDTGERTFLHFDEPAEEYEKDLEGYEPINRRAWTISAIGAVLVGLLIGVFYVTVISGSSTQLTPEQISQVEIGDPEQEVSNLLGGGTAIAPEVDQAADLSCRLYIAGETGDEVVFCFQRGRLTSIKWRTPPSPEPGPA